MSSTRVLDNLAPTCAVQYGPGPATLIFCKPKPVTTAHTPRETLALLDQYVVGQNKAKRAVAVAVRNRWRRRQLDPDLAREVTPKNIIMIGPTGVGKTEIARRLAKLTSAPFIKVEASKYTEVGYYGRDVESMIRDLVENAIGLVRERERKSVEEEARRRVEERLGAQPAAHHRHALRGGHAPRLARRVRRHA